MLTETSSAWNFHPRRRSPILPATAPNNIGSTATYRLTFLTNVGDYAVHWGSKGRKAVPLPGNAGRAKCQGRGCPLCHAGYTRQVFYTALVLDLERECVAVVSMSDALWQNLLLAAKLAKPEPLDAAPQVEFVISAERVRGGPRYSVELRPLGFGPDHALHLVEFIGTDEGDRWWADTVAARTSEKLLGGQGLPDLAIDPLDVIFPGT